MKNSLFIDGGEMGSMMQDFDWSATPVGPIESWPLSLRTAVSIVVNSTLPMFIWWDKNNLTNFYNDRYKDILGNKHPDALGASGKEIWSEIWDEVGPLAAEVFLKGKSVYKKDLKLIVNRQNHDEEAYFTFSYSPILNENFEIGGLCCTVVETTQEVIARRNMLESEARFRTMAESSEFLIAIADEKSNATYFNQSWTDFTGRPTEDLKVLGWADLIHPKDRKAFLDTYVRAIEQKTSFQGEFRMMSKNGEYRWLLAKGPARYYEDGNFAGHISSCIDITDIKKAIEDKHDLMEITAQRNALARLSKSKDEFIAVASHQLRTPATAVKQYIALLLQGFAGPLTEKQMELMSTAYENNERQLNIVNDLLKTAQLDSEDFHLKRESHDIISLIHSAVSEVDSSINSKKQTIELDAPYETLHLPIDNIEIKMAVINLLENASKYSYEHTKIFVKVRKTQKLVIVTVKDQGVGVSQENYKNIFEKFTRVNNELTESVSGTGLGLYWAKRVVRLHKGKLYVSSIKRKGSTFTMELPL